MKLAETFLTVLERVSADLDVEHLRADVEEFSARHPDLPARQKARLMIASTSRKAAALGAVASLPPGWAALATAGTTDASALAVAVGALDGNLYDTTVEMVLTPGLDLGGADHRPKAGNLSGGRKAQPLEGTATGPIHHRVLGECAIARRRRNNPFSQIVDLLKTVATGDGQGAATPKIFQGSFGGMPIPPALCPFLLISTQVACHDWTIGPNVAQYLVNLLLEPPGAMSAPHGP